MAKKKKPLPQVELPPPIRKNYLLFAPDVIYSGAVYAENRVTIAHSEDSYTEVIDTGNGYHIKDVSPGGTHTHDLDYAVAADFFAALKIFYHNADKINGEYWTIFQGEKI